MINYKKIILASCFLIINSFNMFNGIKNIANYFSKFHGYQGKNFNFEKNRPKSFYNKLTQKEIQFNKIKSLAPLKKNYWKRISDFFKSK